MSQSAHSQLNTTLKLFSTMLISAGKMSVGVCVASASDSVVLCVGSTTTSKGPLDRTVFSSLGITKTAKYFQLYATCMAPVCVPLVIIVVDLMNFSSDCLLP